MEQLGFHPGKRAAITGPGKISVDALIGRKYSGMAWALAALVVGALGAGIQLATRVKSVVQTEAKTA